MSPTHSDSSLKSNAIEKLTSTAGYSTWCFKEKQYLKSKGLWEHVTGNEPRPERLVVGTGSAMSAAARERKEVSESGIKMMLQQCTLYLLLSVRPNSST